MNTAFVARSRRYSPGANGLLNPYEYTHGNVAIRQTTLSLNIFKALEVFMEEWLRSNYDATLVIDPRTSVITIIVSDVDSKFPTRRNFISQVANLYEAQLPFDIDKPNNLFTGFSRDKKDRVIGFGPISVKDKGTLNLVDYYRGWSVMVIPFAKTIKLSSYVV